MNFIGHAMLVASGSDDFLFGNLIADGIKGSDLSWLPAEIERGVRWHRHVDAVIDSHLVVRSLLDIMPQRRVANIALDVVWDHFLAKDELAPALAERCYRLLSTRELPNRQRSMFQHLVNGRWLEGYADFTFTLRAISGIGQRLRGENRLAQLEPWLRTHYDLLEHSHHILWPDLQKQLSRA